MRRYLPGLLLLLVACGDAAPPPREFNGAVAFTYLERQVGFGYRIPGTPAHAATAAWLDSLLRTRADSVVVQAWDHVTGTGDTLPRRNFLARFNLGARERILFLAHWDTRPLSDNPDYKGPQTPVPGANDGASGVAVLLGMADALKLAPPAVGVDLLFVDGGVSLKKEGACYMRMSGNAVFKMAVNTLDASVDETLQANGLNKTDIDWLVPHQANIRIILATAKKLGMSMERVVVTVDRHGNTSAASIPLALDTAVRDGKIHVTTRQEDRSPSPLPAPKLLE